MHINFIAWYKSLQISEKEWHGIPIIFIHHTVPPFLVYRAWMDNDSDTVHVKTEKNIEQNLPHNYRNQYTCVKIFPLQINSEILYRSKTMLLRGQRHQGTKVMISVHCSITLFWSFSLLFGFLLSLNICSFLFCYSIRLALSILYSLTHAVRGKVM